MSDFAAFRRGTEGTRSGHGKTAFVFAGGGSFGSIQVGMLRALAAHGITADRIERGRDECRLLRQQPDTRWH